MKVILAGGSGLTGTSCLNLLRSDSSFTEIHLLSRKNTVHANGGIHEHIVDFHNLDIPHIPADAVVCCLGTTMQQAGSAENFKKVDYTYVLNLARWARKHEIPKFLVVTATGANPDSTIFYNRIKGEIEEALMQLDFPTLYIFRPSIILGKRKDKRRAEEVGKFLMQMFSPLMRGPFSDYRPVHANQIARSLVKALKSTALGTMIISNSRIRRA